MNHLYNTPYLLWFSKYVLIYKEEQVTRALHHGPFIYTHAHEHVAMPHPHCTILSPRRTSVSQTICYSIYFTLNLLNLRVYLNWTFYNKCIIIQNAIFIIITIDFICLYKENLKEIRWYHIFFHFFQIDAVVVQGHKGNATVVGSIPTRRNGLLFINIFICSLWPRQKPGVELRHSTRSVCTRLQRQRIQRPTLLYVGDRMSLIFFYYFSIW